MTCEGRSDAAMMRHHLSFHLRASRPIQQQPLSSTEAPMNLSGLLHLSATYVNPPAPLINKRCADMSSQLTFPEWGGTRRAQKFWCRAGERRRGGACWETFTNPLHSGPIWVQRRLHTRLPPTRSRGSRGGSGRAGTTAARPSLGPGGGLRVCSRSRFGAGVHFSFASVDSDLQEWDSVEG